MENRNQFNTSNEIKITFLGSSQVGKTSLLFKWISNTFRTDYDSTVGAIFMSKASTYNSRSFKLQIWDTSGQEKYRPLFHMYIKNAKVVVLVFDVTQRQSLEDLESLIRQTKESNLEAQYLLIGNKIDLVEQRQITEEEGREYAHGYGASYIEVSAKECSDLTVIESKIFELCDLDAQKQSQGLEHVTSTAVRTTTSPSNSELIGKIETFRNSRPENITVQNLGIFLKSGVKNSNPSDYFMNNLDIMRSYVLKLQFTSKSLANTAVNIIITVLLALSVVGLPLAYCSGWLEKNKQASGHSLMFTSFGAKQAAQTLFHQVLEETKTTGMKL